ncbi:hypothetical protein [Polaribacter sp. HaHaR_3_91]|jgi:hypothetical protein|uniref:hypothetical protein n=1 Tax=Polaribacter sp. HaHaR_3_91 TaxID=2745561 RepID=UPI001C4FE3D1|nr:hypothetical protein [Polaribacter sp. HaHaR_3_91]QXP63260.1 hypothetical protein H0I27_15635 [Polaribacter sp. HaHaR_3_91]
MKKLELNQMEVCIAGKVDYGDMTCSEFWTAASIAAGGASWYATAVFGPIGGVGMFLVSVAASIKGASC